MNKLNCNSIVVEDEDERSSNPIIILGPGINTYH